MKAEDWYGCVGKFMLAFGDIEHTTVGLLGCLPSCNIPKSAPKLTLGARIDMLLEVLPRYPEPEFREVLRCLEAVAKHSGTRNLVAHNTVWFDVAKVGDRIEISSHLVSTRDRKKRLKLAEMKRLADDVHELARQLSEAAVEVMKRYVPDVE
ncbi:hypothetical protein [Arenimonas sp.]|uniref:hypothetical protein n=1 Tax=Arenimonas sp. TaxID=1872635 RepID=UPI0025E624A0|nr:hypothetical protein [Arenimonas sp.]